MSDKQELTQKLIQSRDEIRRRVIHEDNKRRLSMLLLAHRIEMYEGFDRRQKPRVEGV